METDVKEKFRSLFRFLSLAAFILGSLWFLLAIPTGRSWLSGMIGLTLALVGYIILRKVDEERGWGGSLRRAERLVLGKIRTWPLWIRYGLLSLVLAVTMLFGGQTFFYQLNSPYFIAVVIAPLMIISIFSRKILDLPIGLWAFTASGGFWFLIGILLGKVKELSGGKYWVYIIAWLAIFNILAVATIIILD